MILTSICKHSIRNNCGFFAVFRDEVEKEKEQMRLLEGPSKRAAKEFAAKRQGQSADDYDANEDDGKNNAATAALWKRVKDFFTDVVILF